jgi:hypothetical protein
MTLEDLRLQVRNKFKDLFKLSEEAGKNQFKRDNFLQALKENGLDFIDENIKIIKNSDSYEPKYKKVLKNYLKKMKGV